MDYKNILIKIFYLSFVIFIFYLIYRKNRFRKIINEGFVDKQNSSNKKYRLIGIDENFYVYTKENLSSEWVSIPNNSRMLSITQINSGIFWAVGRDWNFKGSSILYHFLTRDNIISPKTVFKTVLSGYRGINICVAPDGNKLYAIGADGLLYISNENHTGFSNAGVPNPGGVIMNQLFLKDNTLHGVGRNNKIYKLVGNNFEYATIYNKIPITGASQLDDGTFLCASNTKLYQWVNNEWSDRGINNNKKIFYLSPMIGGTPQNKDCEYTEGNWSECDQPCGPGKQTKTNTIKAQAIGLGKACPKEQESKECKIKDCDKDCVYTESNWSECDKACGIGKQTKTFTIKSEGSGKGKSCPKNPLSKDCKIKDCEINCNYGEWRNEGGCDKPCGPGKQKQVRTNLDPSIEKCKPEVKFLDCFLKECAVDCNYVEGQWSTCNRGCGRGKQTKTNVIIKEAKGAGSKPCPPVNESKDCKIKDCDQDCEVLEWNDWSNCSTKCGIGTKIRTPKRVRQPIANGAKCPDKETAECVGKECPVDCNVIEWNTWSECSKKCGRGTRTRTPKRVEEPKFGGARCPDKETAECTGIECDVDCKINWGEWSQCSKTCGGGKRTRRAVVERRSELGGAACPALEDTEDCSMQPCPVDCKMGEWENVGICSKTCGGGKQKQSRKILVRPVGAGQKCGPGEREIECNTAPCGIDCIVSNWKTEGECSRACGGGKIKRVRTVERQPEFGGARCPDDLVRFDDCNMQSCEAKIGNWENVGNCSKKCGGGQQLRRRTITEGFWVF